MRDLDATTIFWDLILTALVYGGFPLAFAALRNTKITIKKYKWICIIYVAVIYFYLSLELFDGSGNAYAPAIWGIISYRVGKNILLSHNLLVDEEVEMINEVIKKEQEQKVKEIFNVFKSTPSEQEHKSTEKYCTNCGNKLGDNDKFCSRCGNKVNKG